MAIDIVFAVQELVSSLSLARRARNCESCRVIKSVEDVCAAGASNINAIVNTGASFATGIGAPVTATSASRTVYTSAAKTIFASRNRLSHCSTLVATASNWLKPESAQHLRHWYLSHNSHGCFCAVMNVRIVQQANSTYKKSKCHLRTWDKHNFDKKIQRNFRSVVVAYDVAIKQAALNHEYANVSVLALCTETLLHLSQVAWRRSHYEL